MSRMRERTIESSEVAVRTNEELFARVKPVYN
jgi:hypothetical protein